MASPYVATIAGQLAQRGREGPMVAKLISAPHYGLPTMG